VFPSFILKVSSEISVTFFTSSLLWHFLRFHILSMHYACALNLKIIFSYIFIFYINFVIINIIILQPILNFGELAQCLFSYYINLRTCLQFLKRVTNLCEVIHHVNLNFIINIKARNVLLSCMFFPIYDKRVHGL